jgi:hypothetical protein
MFVNLLTALLAASALSASEPDASKSCAELVALREEADAAAARLAAWMERHCPGALEDTDPFCRFQSRSLLERLADLGEVKQALEAKGCELRQVRDASVQRRASRIQPISSLASPGPEATASLGSRIRGQPC